MSRCAGQSITVRTSRLDRCLSKKENVRDNRQGSRKKNEEQGCSQNAWEIDWQFPRKGDFSQTGLAFRNAWLGAHHGALCSRFPRPWCLVWCHTVRRILHERIRTSNLRLRRPPVHLFWRGRERAENPCFSRVFLGFQRVLQPVTTFHSFHSFVPFDKGSVPLLCHLCHAGSPRLHAVVADTVDRLQNR
jgi:hypothetical protein